MKFIKFHQRNLWISRIKQYFNITIIRAYTKNKFLRISKYYYSANQINLEINIEAVKFVIKC